jgi:hypothetical protein
MDTDNDALEQQLLEKLLAERMELDQHITFLQKRLKLPVNGSSPIGASSVPTAVEQSVGIQRGEFHGLSRPLAAAALLRKAKKNLKTNEIFEKLKESGYEGLSNKNSFNGLYTALSRTSELTKVAPNTWGLREWYPHLKEPKAKVVLSEPAVGLSLDEVEGK